MHESDYNSDDEVNIRSGTNAANPLHQINFEALNRLKSEELAQQANEMLQRMKQQQEYDEAEDLDDMDMKPEERSQRELMAAMQRHAAQVAAAAAAAGLPNAAHLANLAASVGSLGNLHLNSNAICQLNSVLLGSNSSPSGSSSSAHASSPAIQSIEPGKGYTYEEQFKQVGPVDLLIYSAHSISKCNSCHLGQSVASAHSGWFPLGSEQSKQAWCVDSMGVVEKSVHCIIALGQCVCLL